MAVLIVVRIAQDNLEVHSAFHLDIHGSSLDTGKEWGHYRVTWEFDQASDTYTHPRTGDPFVVQTDQVGRKAFFVARTVGAFTGTVTVKDGLGNTTTQGFSFNSVASTRTRRYLSGSGSDSNDGLTGGTAWLTLNKALGWLDDASNREVSVAGSATYSGFTTTFYYDFQNKQNFRVFWDGSGTKPVFEVPESTVVGIDQGFNGFGTVAQVRFDGIKFLAVGSRTRKLFSWNTSGAGGLTIIGCEISGFDRGLIHESWANQLLIADTLFTDIDTYSIFFPQGVNVSLCCVTTESTESERLHEDESNTRFCASRVQVQACQFNYKSQFSSPTDSRAKDCFRYMMSNTTAVGGQADLFDSEFLNGAFQLHWLGPGNVKDGGGDVIVDSCRITPTVGNLGTLGAPRNDGAGDIFPTGAGFLFRNCVWVMPSSNGNPIFHIYSGMANVEMVNCYLENDSTGALIQVDSSANVRLYDLVLLGSATPLIPPLVLLGSGDIKIGGLAFRDRGIALTTYYARLGGVNKTWAELSGSPLLTSPNIKETMLPNTTYFEALNYRAKAVLSGTRGVGIFREKNYGFDLVGGAWPGSGLSRYAGSTGIDEDVVPPADVTAPTLLSIHSASPSPTVVSPLSFTAKFSEPVTGVVAARFALTLTGTVGGTSVGTPVVVGDGTVWTIPVIVGSGTGTVRLDLASNTNIKDLALNTLSTTTQNGLDTISVDFDSPQITGIIRLDPDGGSPGVVNYGINFSESVTGLTLADLSLVTSGISGAAFNGQPSGVGATWQVQVSTGTGSGTIRVDFANNTQGVIDQVGWPVGQQSFTGQIYTIIRTAPPPVDSNTPTATLSVAAPPRIGKTTLSFTVTYVDDIAIKASTIGAADILVTGPNGYSQNASFISLSVPGDGTPKVATYRINAPGTTWDNSDNGTYTVSVLTGAVTDTSDNPVAAGIIGTFVCNLRRKYWLKQA